MRTGAATLVLGAVLVSTDSAAQAAARGRGAELAVRVAVLTAEPRRGAPVEAEVRISATGAAARNTMLFLAAGPPARLRVSGVCAPAAPGYCGLGTVDSAGRAVPFTVEVPAGSSPLTLDLGAFTWADGRWPAGTHSGITFAPSPPEGAPSPPPTADPPPAAPVAADPVPTDPLWLPPVPPDASLPAAPTGSPGPSGRPAAASSPPPPGASTTLVVAEEPGAGQSIRLGVLLAACVLTSALAFRRGARIRRRPGGSGRG
ncbi:hypothetical protein [Actinocorallia libanotica]|uniref:Uncharacterized protein n=1 Tax=Actinocorallia libanotica TaxID=46162 RepID=A0ABP4C909_9ACTN